MRLTTRDKELIQLLQSYGCLTTKQIAEKLFLGVRLTTVLRRLRHLHKAVYIQKVLGLESSERLWAVTKKSAEKFQFDSSKTCFPRAILEHDLLLSTLRIRLEECGIAHSWVPEHEIRRTVARRHGLREVQRRVIPDGIMGVEINGIKESIAIEVELSPKNQNRYQQILRDYSRKESIFAVWYLVQSRTLQRQIEQAQKFVYAGSKSPKIYFSLIDDVLKNPLQAAIGKISEMQKVSELFTAKTAHWSAHEVSGRADSKTEIQNTVTTEDHGSRPYPHAPCGDSSSIAGHPPPT